MENEYREALERIKELLEEDFFENWDECVEIATEVLRRYA